MREVIRLQSSPRAATAAVVPEPRVRIVQLAPGALVLNRSLIPGFEDWMLIAGLIAVIVLLLGWVLRLYAYNRTVPAAPPPPHIQPVGLDTVTPVVEQPDAKPPVAMTPAPDAKVPGRVATRQSVTGKLKELDTLIAFEQYDQAREKLQLLIDKDPENPEYLLRHYHLRSMNDVDTDADDEALLRALMDGPLSDTLLRVKAMGKSMMPGDPLFNDDASRDAALRVMNEATRAGAQARNRQGPAADFNSTVIIAPNAGDKPGDSGS